MTKKLQLILLLITLIFGTYVFLGKFANIQYAEECSEPHSKLIVSEIGPFWIRLAGDNELLFLGTRTKYPRYSGSKAETWLVYLGKSDFSVIYYSEYIRPNEAGIGTELIRNICQQSYSLQNENGENPLFYSPDFILSPKDFSNGWEVSMYSQTKESIPEYYIKKRINDFDSIMVAETEEGNRYRIELWYHQYASEELAFEQARSTRPTTNFPDKIVNSELFSEYGDAFCNSGHLCFYEGHYKEWVVGIGIQSFPSRENIFVPISDEVLQYIFELTINKFLENGVE